MADNTILPIPQTTGDTIAADDIGGIKFQRVKMTLGADGSNEGDVSSANPLPITGTVLIDGTSTNAVSDGVQGTDIALTTHSVIVGETTAGGGSFVNVKVNPSGALAVDSSGSSVTVTNFPATQVISAASLPLPTGAATETTLAALNGKFGALGQQLMASSAPVVIASNQSAVPTRNVPTAFTTITQAFTAALQTMTVDVSDCSSLMLHALTAGSTGHVGIFQGSIDGTNYFTIRGVRTDSQTTDAATFGAVTANLAYAWKFNTSGLNFFRYNCTGHTTGTVTWVAKKMIQEFEPIIGFPATQPVSGTVNASLNGATNSIGYVGLQIPLLATDVASAALTTTTTTASFTPAFGITYVVNIPVTAVSGTTPTLDIGVEESDDGGTNWYRVYDFPRITATGSYRSPPLTLRGNRIRYVQTVGGTTPSFTRAINRLQRSDDAPLRAQFIDRAIVPNTLNSTTASFYVEGLRDFNFMVRCTAQTTAATITVQFSHDGTNWHTTTNTLTTVNGIAHAKVQNEQWKFGRLIVTAAGTGITLGEAMIIGAGS